MLKNKSWIFVFNIPDAISDGIYDFQTVYNSLVILFKIFKNLNINFKIINAKSKNSYFGNID